MNRRRILLLMALAVIGCFAYAGTLLMVPLSSDIYDEIEALYSLSGKNVYLTSKPWSESDAEALVENITSGGDEIEYLKERILSELRHTASYSYSISLSPLSLSSPK